MRREQRCTGGDIWETGLYTLFPQLFHIISGQYCEEGKRGNSKKERGEAGEVLLSIDDKVPLAATSCMITCRN